MVGQFKKRLFALANQDSIFSHTQENSKMLNITSKYSRFFNNKPPASWVAHITRDFLTCCGLNGYVYTLKIVVDIMDKLTHDFQNVCGCLTLNDVWKLPFIGNLKAKSWTCFKHQINITVVLLACEMFFKYKSMFWVNGVYI